MDLLLIHLVALAWLSLAAAWRWTSRGADLVLAAVGIVWTNILATLLVLSVFRAADSSITGLLVSIALGAAVALLAGRFPLRTATDSTTATSPLWRLSVLSVLVLLAIGSAVAGNAFAPFSPAALDETLPRTFFLLGKTGLLPRDSAGAGEVLFTLNRNALHAWGLMFYPNLAALSIVNTVGWAIAGIAVYRCSLLAGAAMNHALLATVCALAALPVLAQAATLDPQLWAAAAILAAAGFITEYARNARAPAAAFGGLFAGLAAGSSAPALATVMLGVTWSVARRPTQARAAWKFFVPGLVFGLLPLLANTALALGGDFSAFAAAWTRGLGSIASIDFLNGASFAGAPIAPTELTVGPGILGLLCLTAAAFAAKARSATAPLGWLALAWLAGAMFASLWHPFDSRAWVPVILLAAPSVAAVANRFTGAPVVARLFAVVLLFAAVWSAHGYLWRNAWRPLVALWDNSIALRLPSELSRSLEFHLARGTRLQLAATAATDLATHPTRTEDCIVFPLSGSARQRALAELDAGPSYILLPFPGKATAGIEFLGRAHLGVDARDYFGLYYRTDHSVEERNRFLLITVSSDSAPGEKSRLRVDLKGLHIADAATLEIVAEDSQGRRMRLATFTASGAQNLQTPHDLHRLHFRLIGRDDGAEKSVVALDQRLPGEFTHSLAADPKRILDVELVARSAPEPLHVDAQLRPPDGPYPQWGLPLTRAMRGEKINLTVRGQPDLAKLRISFSARLQQRTDGILAVVCNGAVLQRLHFREPMQWQQVVVEAPAVAGVNTIELQDLPLPPSPDWSAYLRRYPDVKTYLELTRQPPHEGARIHYESSGRAEGRAVVLIDQPRPAPDALYYLFRSMRVEGFKP